MHQIAVRNTAARSVLGLGLILIGVPAASAQGALPYAAIASTARVKGGLGCRSFGSGLAVGDGIVLTADHVLLDAVDLARVCHLAGPVRVEIRIGGQRGTMVSQGLRTNDPAMSFLRSSDYAILRVAGRAPRLRPCAAASRPGQPVLVILRDGPVATAIAATQTPKGGNDANYVDLDRVFDHGTSGAGVLDAATHCVLGLISHRFPEPEPTVTRMTPVAVFVAAWQRARLSARVPMR